MGGDLRADRRHARLEVAFSGHREQPPHRFGVDGGRRADGRPASPRVRLSTSARGPRGTGCLLVAARQPPRDAADGMAPVHGVGRQVLLPSSVLVEDGRARSRADLHVLNPPARRAGPRNELESDPREAGGHRVAFALVDSRHLWPIGWASLIPAFSACQALFTQLPFFWHTDFVQFQNLTRCRWCGRRDRVSVMMSGNATESIASAALAAAASPSSAVTPTELEQTKKKKDKVRSAWISFVGRIVAQIMGAVASITLGLAVLQKYQAPRHAEQVSTAIEREQPHALPARLVTPGETSIVVLPLETYSREREDYFADGMPEAAIAALSGVDGLHVISRTSSMQYKGQPKTVPEIARDLNTDLVLEASVPGERDRARITVQLIDGKRDEHLWAESYDRTIRDVLSVQSEVAAAIARRVTATIATAGSPEQAAGPTRAD